MHRRLTVLTAVMASFFILPAEITGAAMLKQVKRVPLTVEEAGGVDRTAWPVTQGVPFAEGDFPVGTAAQVVLEDGTAIPTQTFCLTTWSKKRKFVKWLLVDFQIDLRANQTRQVYLEYGPSVKTVKPKRVVTVTDPEDSKVVRVDTGAMQLDLRTDSPDFISACRVQSKGQWRKFLGCKGQPYLYMTDQKGKRYQSNYSPKPPTIAVEDAGPIRASICIRGRHASADGKSFCPYILRIHAYAGRGDLRIYHTFVFTGDPNNDESTEVGMNFPMDLGADVKMAFGGSGGVHKLGKAKTGLFLQSSDLEYTVSRDSKKFGSGDKTSGWASVSGRDGSVIVALRDLWQEYPKGIELSAEGIDVQFWPKAYTERMIFRTPFYEKAIYFKATRNEDEVKRLLAARPTAPLNLKSFAIGSEEALVWVEQMIARYAPNRAASHNDTSSGCNGYGAAKTHEFMISLSPTMVSSAQCEALGRCVQQPVIAPAEPAYTCATKAVRHAYHKGDPMFKEIDAGLDTLVETIILEPRRLCRRYGMWMWGSLICSHSPGAGRCYWYHKNNGTPMIASKYLGPYNNESNDQVWNVWFNFVRTGSRKHFLVAESVSEQMADVTIYHAGDWAGLMHYHNAHYWSGFGSPSHTLTGGLMLHYYFTGNRRILDVAKEMADWAVRNQEPCGIISNRLGWQHREFTGPLLCVLDVYQATWEEKYGQLAKRSLTWLLRTQETPGILPVTVFTRGEMGDEAWVDPGGKPGVHIGAIYPVYYDGYRLFKNELLRKTILAEADQYVYEEPIDHYYTEEMARKKLPKGTALYSINDKWYWGGDNPPWFSLPTVCIAYDITGDPIYAAYAHYILYECFVDRAIRANNMIPMSFTHVCFAQPVLALMRIVHDAIEKDPEAFKQAQVEWRRRRQANGTEFYAGPYDWLPRDQNHFDSGGKPIGAKPIKLKGLRDDLWQWKLRQPKSIGRISPD